MFDINAKYHTRRIKIEFGSIASFCHIKLVKWLLMRQLIHSIIPNLCAILFLPFLTQTFLSPAHQYLFLSRIRSPIIPCEFRGGQQSLFYGCNTFKCLGQGSSKSNQTISIVTAMVI